ncbi:MAG: lipase family protein [Phycisphaerales bacterium]|nr:lipase family protein [Phycisphaerales bacterium]
MNFRNFKSCLFIVSILLFITGCKKKFDGITPPTSTPVAKVLQQGGNIVSQKLVGQLQTTDVVNILKKYATSLPSFTQTALNNFIANNIRYAVDVYSITYTTTLADGSSIVASGAILCPHGSQAVRMASYQHATSVNKDDVPSNYANFVPGQGTGSETYLMALPFAADGYVVSCPDYVGFGSTYGKVESYVSKQSITNTFDMLQATKEFVKQQNISLRDDSIAIYGYSEGGYMSLGLHQMIEAQTQWPVSLDFAGAGPYDIKSMTDSVFNSKAIRGGWNFMGTYALALYSLLEYYPLPSLNIYSVINQPYADNLLKTSTISWPVINRNMTNDTPAVFFTKSFIEGIKNNTGNFVAFNQLLYASNVYNWKPKYPVTFFTGSLDNFVFSSNSDSAYQAIKRNGGNYIPLDNNYLYIYPNVDHFSGFNIYIGYLYNKFALKATVAHN